MKLKEESSEVLFWMCWRPLGYVVIQLCWGRGLLSQLPFTVPGMVVMHLAPTFKAISNYPQKLSMFLPWQVILST